MAGPIGTLGAIPTITVGGRVFTDLTNLKILTGTANSGVANYTSLKNASLNATRGVYVVPAAKTFILHAVRWIQNGTTTASALGGLFYGDTDLGETAAGPLTNPVGVVSGVAGIAQLADLFITHSGTPGSDNERAIGGSVPTGKYPHFYTNAGYALSLFAYGYEI